MKLDSKEKYDRIRGFIAQLKMKEGIEPFLSLEEISKFGIYDFLFINKNPPSFAIVQKNLRDSKYEQISQFVDDLTKIFIAVSDYAFSDDPIQKRCQFFKQQIRNFHGKFIQEWQSTFQEKKKIIKPRQQKQKPAIIQSEAQPQRIRSVPQPQPVRYVPIIQKKPTLAQKLQMVFLLSAHENNEPYIRSIGQHYGIGSETDDYYTIHLDNKKTSWLNFISRKY